MNTCSCLNLIPACIVYWQASEISRVLSQCDPTANEIYLSLLEHVSPIEWDSAVLYGQYILDRKIVRQLPVIKDSEAIHYIGKNVEVRGFVVSVRTSPLGTVLINFGRDYPNQTFAGFIEAGAKIATDRWIAALAGKIISNAGKIELYQGKPQIKLLSKTKLNSWIRIPFGSSTLTGSSRDKVGPVLLGVRPAQARCTTTDP